MKRKDSSSGKQSKAAIRKVVKAYMVGVRSGKIPASKYIRLAVERHRRDLKEGSARGLYFDEDAGARAVQFFPIYLKHSKGEWAGRPFELAPWQMFIVWVLFGWMNADGHRRFRVAYIEMPRKNGKSTLAAGVGCYMLVADKEPGAEIYTAATKRDQAKIIHDEAVRMVETSKGLDPWCKVVRNNISVLRTNSKWEPLGADSKTMDGLNVHCGILDELHAHPDREVWDKIRTGTGSRRQPLTFAVTIAGTDVKTTICGEQHDYSKRVLDGTIQRDTHFAFIAAIDEGEDWADEKAWARANPNLGVSVKIEYLRDEYETAVEIPAYQNAFKRFHLGLWVKQISRYIPMGPWDEIGELPVVEEQLLGRPCFSGLDLASVTDLAALVHLFPDDDEIEGNEGMFDAVCRFWTPEETVLERARADRVDYRLWIEQGWITATPGNVIDYRNIDQQFDIDAQKFDILEVPFDRWGATKLVQELADRGLKVIQFGQGYKDMTAPTKELLKLVLQKRIRHGGNPVLRWMMDNLVVEMDAAANVKPNRAKSREKIDGVVALIMAIDRATRWRDAPESPYKKRGILFI
ncbi:MAG: terminase TerL endonuclease subunit [bacterium]|nr:terminase TerL endonuclease subunit [bacterium]